MTNPPTPQSTSGLDPRIAGALAYLLGPITGIVFYVIEKDSRFVRFHAAQSITVGVAIVALSIALSILTGILVFIPVLGWLIALLSSVVLAVGSFVLWLMLMWRAYRGEEWQLPYAGEFARKMAG